MTETPFSTTFEWLILNIVISIIFLTTLFVADLFTTGKVDSHGNIQLPSDHLRKISFILHILLFICNFVLLVIHITEYISKTPSNILPTLLSVGIWTWRFASMIQQGKSNHVALIYNKLKQKPVRTEKEGTYLMDPLLNEVKNTVVNSHGDTEELKDTNTTEECRVEKLTSADKVTFSIDVTAFLQLETEKASIVRNFAGGIDGIRKESCSYITKLARQIDKLFTIEQLELDISYDTNPENTFSKLLEKKFRETLENVSHVPMKVAEPAMIIAVILSDEYLAKISEQRRIEIESRNRAMFQEKKETLIKQMMQNTGRTYQECLEEWQFDNNAKISKIKLETSGTGVTQPLVNVNP